MRSGSVSRPCTRQVYAHTYRWRKSRESCKKTSRQCRGVVMAAGTHSAGAAALQHAMQRCTKRTSKNCCALKGDMHGPKSRRPSTRARIANAMFALKGPAGPKTSQKRRPWYPGDGSVNIGCLGVPSSAFADQSNVPPSTSTPPMLVPCPPIHFVADAVMISAPTRAVESAMHTIWRFSVKTGAHSAMIAASD